MWVGGFCLIFYFLLLLVVRCLLIWFFFSFVVFFTFFIDSFGWPSVFVLYFSVAFDFLLLLSFGNWSLLLRALAAIYILSW